MKKLLAALAAVAAFAAASLDFEYGDSRYDVGGQTLRHWNIVPTSVTWKPACALIRSGGWPCGSTAGSYTLTGPTTGLLNAGSTFNSQGNGPTTATVTPADASHGGVFTPATFALAGTNPRAFVYTPLQTGTYNISTTNGGGLTDPAAISYTVSNLAPGYPAMSSGGWVVNHAATLTTGGAGDPFGGANTATLTEDTALDLHSAVSGTFAVTSGQTYTASIMFKAGTGTRALEFQFVDGATFSTGMAADVTAACTVTASGTWGATTLNFTAVRTANLGAGWCLIQMNGTPAFTTGILEVLLYNGGITYTGDGTSSLKLYGPVVQ